MEKLIELLNEYERERKDCSKWDRFDLTTYEKGICLAISKSYGFIKWLVENDKVDETQVRPVQIYDYEGKYSEDAGYSWFNQGPYSRVLMNLAISDSPIEDLISYLKDDTITKGEVKIGSENQDTQELDMTTTYIKGDTYLS